MNNYKTLVLMLIMMFLNIKLFANGIPRGGGIGLEVDSQVFLMELFRGGIINDPNIPMNLKKEYKPQITMPDGISNEVLTNKLRQIYASNTGFAWALEHAIKMINWNITPFDSNGNKPELCDPGDFKSIFSYLPGKTRTLALRQNKFIHIDNKYWNRMNKVHQAGLILHEAIYTMLLSVKENRTKDKIQLSSITRDIVQFLFSTEFKNLHSLSKKRNFEKENKFEILFKDYLPLDFINPNAKIGKNVFFNSTFYTTFNPNIRIINMAKLSEGKDLSFDEEADFFHELYPVKGYEELKYSELHKKLSKKELSILYADGNGPLELVDRSLYRDFRIDENTPDEEIKENLEYACRPYNKKLNWDMSIFTQHYKLKWAKFNNEDYLDFSNFLTTGSGSSWEESVPNNSDEYNNEIISGCMDDIKEDWFELKETLRKTKQEAGLID